MPSSVKARRKTLSFQKDYDPAVAKSRILPRQSMHRLELGIAVGSVNGVIVERRRHSSQERRAG